ncbi:MAG TPA: tetratricopeptide repeat protein [Saprospiraceae bacterium]|nr:tetratricopeptide repeat protein [Saprospiraceae bacterium]
MIRIFSVDCRFIYWKIMLIVILIFSISERSIAQSDSNLESFFVELQKEIADTARVNILNAISNNLIQAKNYPAALPYSREALSLAEKIHYAKGIGHANLDLGVQEVENKNYALGLEIYNIALEIFEETKDTLGLARYYHRSGNILFRQKLRYEGIERYKIAIILYEKLAKTYPEESNKYLLAELFKICDAATFIPDYKLAGAYCREAYELAEKSGNKKTAADALCSLGSMDYEQGNYSVCVDNLKKSLELYEQSGPLTDVLSKHNISYIYYALGVSYSRFLGDLKQGLIYHEISKKMSEEEGDYRGVCQSMLDIGFDLFSNEHYTEALEQWLSALDLGEKIKDNHAIATANRYIGDVLEQNHNYDEAEKHYGVAKRIYEELNDYQGTSSTLHKLGLIQMGKGNKEPAVRIFETMRMLGEEKKDTHVMVIAYTNLLLLDEPLEKYPDLLKSFLSDLKAQEKKGYNELTMDIYRFTGVCYLKMQDYFHAEEYLIKSLELAKTLGNKRGVTYAYRNLKLVKSARLDFEKALEYSDLFALYLDSLRDENSNRVLAEIQTKYDTEKKEKEILSLQSEKQISDLELKVHQEALNRINLEKEKIQTENLFNLSQVDLLANEKRLQYLELEKNQIEMAMQKAETDKKEGQLVLLNKEGEIQMLEIKKQTLLKNSLLGGIGVLMLFGLFVYNNHITRQKLKLQTLRNKIASDLHDDVGSTLSSIYIFSEIARQQSSEVMPMLDTIGESSKKMLDAMADIVWTINPENDDFEKILDRMRSFAYELLGAKKIEFEFDAGDDLNQMKLPMDFRKNLYLIFKEATNNMVKYSDANKAYFSLKEENKNLTMVIRDNGKGFDLSKSSSGNGLRNMQKRAEEIGGKLWIESRNNEGTTIRFKVAV